MGVLATAAVVVGLTAAAVPATAASSGGGKLTKVGSRPDSKPMPFVVVLKEPAATRYEGGRAGLARTQAANGRFDGRSAAVRAYSAHLRSTQRSIADRVGATVQRSFTVALNGFSAQLTTKQAAELRADRRVELVQRDVARKLNTSVSPTFLGLTGKNGAWTTHGGPAKAGAGTVVGIIDSGIWPEAKSFAGRRLTSTPKTKYDIRRVGEATFMDKADGTRFQGACELGQEWTADNCNTKLIGARYYDGPFVALPDNQKSPDEYLSARDGDGHGTHTASTAAGNYGVRASVEGRKFGKISGMAPAARVAAYKVCFSDTDEATGDCYTSSSLAAIDDAVSDGVDVLNYSISGAIDTIVDPVEIAFEGAAEAGIFVAASAGNSGPDESTVAHNSPWLATVAASTHVSYENTVVLGNGRKLAGASINGTPLASHKLVNSTDVAASTPEGANATLCGPDSLDGTKVANTIVICTRGTYDRVAKSAEVKRAGGVGMILVNPTDNSLDADFHSVPTVHLSVANGAKVLSYAASAGASATAKFQVGNTTKKVTPIPQIAGFSSRGPAVAMDSDILKPDIAAPGVSVLAAVAPPTNSGRKFDLYSGTSMASPHIAGLGAFLMGVHPNWTPMQVKSAMMTTARSLVDDKGRPANDPFAQGAGNVRPKRFFNPGLFVTSGPRDWRGLLADQGLSTGAPAIAPSDLNEPSLAKGQVISKVTFTRTFTATRAGRWATSAKVPGFSVKMAKAVRSDRKGDLIDLRMTFTRTNAPLGEFATGFVTLTGPTTVRIPVALRPVSVTAPTEVTGTGASGSAEVAITAGFTGTLPVTTNGLAQSTAAEDTVASGDQNFYCVPVAADSKLLRADLDSADNSADLDLYAWYYPDQNACENDPLPADFAAVAATGSADESFTIDAPDAGVYLLMVDGFDTNGQPSTDYRLDAWDLNASSNLGSFAADPNPVPVTAGTPTSFDATWTGLTSGRYLGTLEYDGALAPTTVLVDVP